MPSDPAELADALIKTVRAIAEPELRTAYLRGLLTGDAELGAFAAALDLICARAEQAEPAAREVLLVVVDTLQSPGVEDHVQRLREEAAGGSHLALGRLVRYPVASQDPRDLPQPEDERIPDYGRGRSLTLGERKSLARRPDRKMTERLLRDPHPDVIRQLLANTKVTEDDVLWLAARRPCRPDVLLEIARSPRWVHRPRIRRALVLNPGTPLDVSTPLVGLLIRQELRLVVESTTVPPALRALCIEHLDRRPPASFPTREDDDVMQ